MRLPEIPADLIRRAATGDAAALNELLGALEPGIFNLVLRLLGHREDARDTTQEILLKLSRSLAGFRGDSAFATWVYRVAANHALSARSRAGEHPEVSFEALGDKLDAGMALGARQPLLPDEALHARRLALACTQGMLLCLDRAQRLAYVLDTAFGLDSDTAAAVLEIQPATYRKRLSRARERLQEFMARRCSLVGAEAACRCDVQSRAVAALARQGQLPPAGLHAGSADLAAAEAEFGRLQRFADAAAAFKAHPAYRSPPDLLAGVRALIALHQPPGAPQ